MTKQHRFYHPHPLVGGEVTNLSTTASGHIQRVLKLSVDTPITLFDGKDNEAAAVILRHDKKMVVTEIQSVTNVSRESPCQLHLFQSLSKGERFDWIVQKAVELGVTAFTPIVSARTVVRLDKERQHKKMHHWQGIIISASEQCGRNRLMILHPPQSLADYWSTAKTAETTILQLHPQAPALTTIQKHQPVHLLIGPEGGFSPNEVSCAQQHGAQLWGLGPRILRTETAAVVGCGLVQAQCGDLYP